MNADEILTRTFTEHEHLAPDAGSVLVELRRQLDGGTRTTNGRRRRVMTRVLAPLTALGVAASVTGIAVATGALTDGHGGSHRTTVSAAGKSTSTPSAHTTPASASPVPDMTIGAGWLPGKATQVEALAGPGGTMERDYDVRVGGTHVDVLLDLEPGPALPTRAKAGTPHDLTVNGHPAREFVTDGFYEVAFKIPGGKIAVVYSVLSSFNGHPSQVSDPVGAAANLTRVGRHVARSMRFDRHDPIPVSVALTWLPDGVTIASVGTSHHGKGRTNYTLRGPGGTSRDGGNAAGPHRPMVDPSASAPTRGGAGNAPAMVEVGGTDGGVAGDIGSAGRPVQGHRTEVRHSGRSYELVVYDFRPGVPVTISTGAGVRTLDELYRIADGIRWVG